MDDIREAAEAYCATFSSGGLAPQPVRRLAVVACMDARLHPERLFGFDLGDAHVIRNAGGRATDDVIRSLVLSTWVLGTRQVVVVHHTDCGLLGREADIRGLVAVACGRDDLDLALLAFVDLDDSVRDDVRTIRENPLLPQDLDVSGFVYDVSRGRLRPVSAE
jgi:carbonic anhydrase